MLRDRRRRRDNFSRDSHDVSALEHINKPEQAREKLCSISTKKKNSRKTIKWMKKNDGKFLNLKCCNH